MATLFNVHCMLCGRAAGQLRNRSLPARCDSSSSCNLRAARQAMQSRRLLRMDYKSAVNQWRQ